MNGDTGFRTGVALLQKCGLALNVQHRTLNGETHTVQALQRVKRRRSRTARPKVGPEQAARDAQPAFDLNRPLVTDSRAVEPFRNLGLRDTEASGELDLTPGKLDGTSNGSATHGVEFITDNCITSITDNDKRKAQTRNMRKTTSYSGFYQRLCEAATPLLGENFTQKELGALFGVSQATVSQSWMQDRLPEMARLAEMASTLRVRLDWLVNNLGPKDLESENPQLQALLDLHGKDELFRALVTQWSALKDNLPARVFVLQAAQMHVQNQGTTPAPASPSVSKGKGRRVQRA
jgi:transcriptional regulator with XRE-family HTH domain